MLFLYDYNKKWRVYRVGDRREYYVDKDFKKLEEALDFVLVLSFEYDKLNRLRLHKK